MLGEPGNVKVKDHSSELSLLRLAYAELQAERNQLMEQNKELAKLVAFFVENNETAYQELDRGISTATPYGKTMLEARAILAKVRP